MARTTWIDRTIEAARTEDTPFPWSRRQPARPKPVLVVVKA